ncbi:MAG TPA: TonB-dependent receptor [Hyphomonas sp.]|nr:TonB-dependent receptor [Hyphomonas sp.]
MKRKLYGSSSRAAIGALVGTVVIALTAPAHAQETTTNEDGDRRLQAVIVKSTKRDTTLQDAPISIGVVSSETIDDYHVADLTDLQNFVPNLTVQKTFGNWAVRIRGLGSGVTNIAFDSSVSVFNDGIYCGRSSCLETGLMDVGSVEVARGPQGALFGKSTIAGAISVTSARPTDTFEAYANAGVELEDGGYRMSGAVSGPLSDTLRARLAVQYTDLDGGYKNLFTGHDDNAKQNWGARGSVEWDITPDTLLFAKIEGGSSSTDGRSNQLVSVGALASPNAPINRDYVETVPNDVRYAATGISTPEYDDLDTFDFTTQLTTMLGDNKLELYGNYWHTKSERYLDVDGVPEHLLNTSIGDDYTQKSIEARVLSPTGNTFEYIFGAMYHTSDLDTFQYSTYFPEFYQTLGVPVAALASINGAVGSMRDFHRESDTVSVYGQLTWNLTDKLSLIGDVRYTDESQDGRARNRHIDLPDYTTIVYNPNAPFRSNPEFIFLESRTDTNVDPSIRLLYKMSRDISMYAAYSTGSKPGGLKANDDALGTILLSKDSAFLSKYAGVTSLTASELNNGINLKDGNGVFDFEGEDAENFEVGTKTFLADGKVSLNAAAYLMKFDNMQTSSYDGTRFIIGNAASAEVKGIELEAQWLATDNLKFNASAAFTDAKFDEFKNAQCPIGSDGNQEDPTCVDGEGDLSGRQIERAPKVELNLGANWSHRINANLNFDANVDAYYSSKYYVRQDFDPAGLQDEFTKFNARLAISPAHDRWEIALVGKNLTDELTIQHAYQVLSSFQALGEGRKIFLEGTLRW